MKKKPRALSTLHSEILTWMSKRKGVVVTPDDLARKWWGKEVRHSHQQWAYLQLSRLQAKGLLRRPSRSRYVITTVGVKRLNTAA